jgi:hypothetical protein
MSCKLTPIEALRVQTLLDVALKKLEFLSSISTGTGSELTEFMGDEISRIIQEQRELEKRYEELIAKRSTLTGLANKAQMKEVQSEIQEVGRNLKESNKSLCRNLKENPNVSENLIKMQRERQLVQTWLDDLHKELTEYSFSQLMAKVDEERKNQELLTVVKQREKEVSKTVKQLEQDLAREYAEHEKETRQATQEIKELKQDLQQRKSVSQIELSFEEKKLRAKENALVRIFAQHEKSLREQKDNLEKMITLEKTVHGDMRDFLEKRLDDLAVETKDWHDKAEREIKATEDKVFALREKRGAGLEQRCALQDRMQDETRKQMLKEEEQRNQVMMEKQRNEQLSQEHSAILFLQDEGRRYILRIRERAAAKKGKKGKKKKKK